MRAGILMIVLVFGVLTPTRTPAQEAEAPRPRGTSILSPRVHPGLLAGSGSRTISAPSVEAVFREERGRPGWLLPIGGAVAGGALAAGWVAYACRNEECNIPHIPVALGIVTGALVGVLFEVSLPD